MHWWQSLIKHMIGCYWLKKKSYLIYIFILFVAFISIASISFDFSCEHLYNNKFKSLLKHRVPFDSIRYALPKSTIPASGNDRNFTGTGWREVENSLNPAGNLWKMMAHRSSIPTGKFSDFFLCFTSIFCPKEREASQKLMKKIGRLSGWNTVSMFPLISGVFLLEPARTSWSGTLFWFFAVALYVFIERIIKYKWTCSDMNICVQQRKNLKRIKTNAWK